MCQGLSRTRTFIQTAPRFLRVEKIHILLAVTESGQSKSKCKDCDLTLLYFVIFHKSHFCLFVSIENFQKILFLKTVVFSLCISKAAARPLLWGWAGNQSGGYALAQHLNLIWDQDLQRGQRRTVTDLIYQPSRVITSTLTTDQDWLSASPTFQPWHYDSSLTSTSS